MSEFIHISWACNKNCYNPWETYGYMHCVQCGCCAKDKAERYQNRIELYQRLKKESEEFDLWADVESIRELQEKNKKADIAWSNRRIAYYERKLDKLKGVSGKR